MKIKKFDMESCKMVQKMMGYPGNTRDMITMNWYSSEIMIIEVPCRKDEKDNYEFMFLDYVYFLYMNGKEPQSSYHKIVDQLFEKEFGLTTIQIAALCWYNTYVLPSHETRICTALGELSYLQSIIYKKEKENIKNVI